MTNHSFEINEWPEILILCFLSTMNLIMTDLTCILRKRVQTRSSSFKVKKSSHVFAWDNFCKVFLVSLEEPTAACFQSIFLQKW